MESVARMHIVIIQQIFAVNVMMVITFLMDPIFFITKNNFFIAKNFRHQKSFVTKIYFTYPRHSCLPISVLAITVLPNLRP